MALDTSTQNAISEAWLGMKDWIVNQFPTSALQATLPTVSVQSDLKVCGQLDASGGSTPSIGSYISDGDGTVTLTGLKITAFEQASLIPAQFPAVPECFGDTVVLFPVSFARLQVSGPYNYSQPCVYAVFSHGMGSDTNVTGSGTLSQTATNGQITFNASYTAGSATPLALQNANVTGSIATSVQRDGGGLLAEIGEFLGGAMETLALQLHTGNAFATAAFSQTLLGMLNKKLAS